MTKARVLFRVDSGSKIGLGHLHRCLALAEVLRRLGAGCLFLTSGEPPVQSRVTVSGFEALSLNEADLGGPGDLSLVLKTARDRNQGIVVVDSYHVDAAYLSELREAGRFVVAIDDLALFSFPCQLVVSGSVYAKDLPYRSSSGDTRFLLGPEYAPLRPEFWGVPPRKVRPAGQSLLVTLGGADKHDLMPKLLGLLADLPGDFTITAIVGPFFKNLAETEEIVKGSQRLVRLIPAPESLRDLMLAADVAISGGGWTLYELAATGTPTITLVLADNQRYNVQSMEKQGVVVSGAVMPEQGVVNERLPKTARWLLDNYDKRCEMSRLAQALVDGKGAQRVAQEVLALYDRSR